MFVYMLPVGCSVAVLDSGYYRGWATDDDDVVGVVVSGSAL